MLPIATSAKAADDFDLAKVERQTVQDLPDAIKNGATQALWFGVSNNGPLLAPWGTRERERQLRLYYRHEYGTLLQGAFMGLIKKVKATPWLINGGRNSVNYFQRLFRDAQFGYGWGDFLSRLLLDYMRFDGGAYVELIAPGNPLKPPTGAITGLAHLDSYNCLPTGDPEYPVVYWSRLGKLHLMHRTRILHLVDMPDGDQWNPGYGLCALSRAIAVVEREMLMGRYIEANLNDKPSPGFIIAHNLARSARDQAIAMYRQEQGRDYPPEWGNVVWIESVDKENPPSLENVTFSRPPEKFDYKVYVDIDVDMLALAIGVDHQDLFPLQSRSMGSGAQSEILHEKSKGKAYGDMLISLERALNDVLPESLEFSFKTSDGGQALQDAQIAVSWTTAINQAGARLGMEEGRQLLANQIEAINQVVTDEAGQIVALTDLDVEPITEQQRLNSPLDPAPASTEQAQPQATATDATQNAPSSKPAKKDFADTSAAFVSNFTDLVHAGLTDEISRKRAGVVMRAQLNTAGKAARNDGLVDGGVTTGLSDADLNAHTVWLAKQSAYVTDFLGTVYKQGLTDAEVDQHAQMWSNKALQTAYYEGIQSADGDGMYEFTGSDGKESCATCRDLKGTQMRMSEWTRKELRPGVDTDAYDCGGWNCQHRLEKVAGKSKKKGLETDEQRRWFFAHLGEGYVARTQAGAAPPDTTHMAETHHVTTLDGKFEPDTGTPGTTPDELNHFMNTSNGPLAYAIGDQNIGMTSVDYSGETDAYSINRGVVKSEAAAFVKESQDIHYSREYLVSLAQERAASNGVTLSDSEAETALNQHYAVRAQAIQTLSKTGNVSLTEAQTRRLDTAASGHYLDMVYARTNSDSGSLANAARRSGGQKLSGAALQEARQNFRDWVTIGA